MAEPSSEKPQYAGFGPRALALLIDGLIFVPAFFFNKITFGQTGAIIVVVLFSLIYPLYNILFLGFSGQTLGMRAAGIKVFRQDLSPLRWSNAIFRYSVDILMAAVFIFVRVCLLAQADPGFFDKSLLAVTMDLKNLDPSYETFMLYMMGASQAWTLSELVVLLLNERKRAIHDFIGGTVVTRVDSEKRILPRSQPSSSSLLIKIFTGLVVSGLIFVLAGVGFYQFYLKNKFANLFAPPPELQEAGVRKGQGFVTSGLVLPEDRLGDTFDIVADPANPGAYLAAGKKGILTFRPTGEVLKTTFFDWDSKIYDLQWVVLGNWIGLMNKGTWTHQSSLMDRDGKILWTYETKGGVDDMAEGNIGGDLKPEFVIGMNGGEGLHLLDQQGRLMWDAQGKNVWHVEAADIDGKGKDRIINSNAGGMLVIRDETGSVVRQSRPAAYPAYFTLVPWPQGGEPWVAVIPDQSKFLFYDLQQGAPITEWETGIKIGNGKMRGLWVDWGPNAPKSLALLVNYAPMKASLLTLFDETGLIQYQEVFGEPCEAILAVEGASPGTHELWCGCDNRILRYQKAP